MQIRDLGHEAIDEILAEAADGMKRRTGKRWSLSIDVDHGDLSMTCENALVTKANVRPHLSPPTDTERALGGSLPPEAIRFRSAFRRLVLDATQAITPVPGAANIPAALARAFSAIASLDHDRACGDNVNPGAVHDLHRILDHLTGNDYSGCSSKPSVADYGRAAEAA